MHSTVGASSMHRWGNCPGSVPLIKTLPPSAFITSPHAEEGTRAHTAAADALLYVTGQSDKHPTFFDDEERDAVKAYCAAVMAVVEAAKALGDKPVVHVEIRFSMPELHPGAFGTADCVVWLAKLATLHVFDFKYGKGHIVDPKENEQLQFYAVGAMFEKKYGPRKVVLHIVQPRIDVPPWRDETRPDPRGPGEAFEPWAIPSAVLLDFSEEIRQKATAADDPDAPRFAGPWCRWCPAAAVCPEIHEQKALIAAADFDEIATYDLEKLGELVRSIPTVKAWLKAVDRIAYGLALHGQTVPGYKLVEKYPRDYWKAHVTPELLASVTLLKPEDVTVTKLKTPAQVRKLKMPDIERKNLDAHYIESRSGGYVLVPESDKRQPATPNPELDFEDEETDEE